MTNKKGRPNLLTALKLHGLRGIEGEEKDYWRKVILENEEYTEEQWRGIEWYNRTDADATMALLNVMAPTVDVPLRSCADVTWLQLRVWSE